MRPVSVHATARPALLLCLATFLTMLPVTVIVPGLKEAVADRFGVNDFWTHSFMSVNMIGAVVAVPLIARLNSRRKGLTLAAAALVAQAGLFAAMIATSSFTLVMLARLIEGAMHALALSALLATVADRSDPGRRGRVMGLAGTSMMLGTAVGTRLGGLATSNFPGGAFGLAAGLSLVAAALVVGLAPSTRAPEVIRPKGMHLSLLRRIRPALLFSFVDRFCVGVIVSSLVLFLATAHELDAGQRSRLLALFMIPFALLVYPAGRLVDRTGAAGPLIAGSLAFGLLFASYGIVPTAWLWLLMLVSGVASALMFAPTLALCTDLTPPDRRSAGFAAFHAAGSIGFLLGPLVGGTILLLLAPVLGELSAYRLVFVVAGLSQVVCVMGTIPALRRYALEQSRTNA